MADTVAGSGITMVVTTMRHGLAARVTRHSHRGSGITEHQQLQQQAAAEAAGPGPTTLVRLCVLLAAAAAARTL